MSRARTNFLSDYAMRTRSVFAGIAAVLISLAIVSAAARNLAPIPAPDQAQSRLHIQITGGDDNKPVAEASVYIKFAKDHKSEKGKLTELNIKTNQEGIAQSPQIPQGKILIQVIAPGWKTYGEWHDIAQEEQNIEIHLVRPTTRWY
jgi:hypothetical protein